MVVEKRKAEELDNTVAAHADAPAVNLEDEKSPKKAKGEAEAEEGDAMVETVAEGGLGPIQTTLPVS